MILVSATDFVRAEALEVTYPGPVCALARTSFSVLRGEFLAIVGPSGCGKSTLLRIIAGLQSPTHGLLTVGGQAPAIARRTATRVSFVFQDATLLPWRDVDHNVALPLELERRPRTERRERVAATLQWVGLADFARRYPAELSGGMRMRASLARAMVTDPQLLLLDEPFAALDDITRQTLNEELLALWRARGWTGIFVTHNIGEAVFLSQRILVLGRRPGRIVADVPVKFGAARDIRLRSSAEFARLTGVVAEHLREGSL